MTTEQAAPDRAGRAKTPPAATGRPQFGPRSHYPRLGTTAARDFYATLERVRAFLNYVSHLAVHTDSSYQSLHRALAETAKDDDERQRLERNRLDRLSAVEGLSVHRQFLLEVLLARHIENYLAYVAALLAQIFRQRPETMRSAEKVDVEWVLDHSTMATLIDDLAERKVDALSYSSFTKLYEYTADRFGLPICSESDLPRFVEWIEARNLAVHNRGVTNRRYLDRVQSARRGLGAVREVGIDEIEELEGTLLRTVVTLDRAARSKLRLRGIRFSVPGILREEAQASRRLMQLNLAMMEAKSRPKRRLSGRPQ